MDDPEGQPAFLCVWLRHVDNTGQVAEHVKAMVLAAR
jgi:hypothetical protein